MEQDAEVAHGPVQSLPPPHATILTGGAHGASLQSELVTPPPLHACVILIGYSRPLQEWAGLLVQHRATGLFMVPGGNIGAGETPKFAAAREFVEEVLGLTGEAAISRARRSLHGA